MITICLTVEGNVKRWAQDRSETFDNSFTVCKQEDAKRFGCIRSAHAWLAKHKFMRRSSHKNNGTGFTCAKIPAPFISWELDGVCRETKVSL